VVVVVFGPLPLSEDTALLVCSDGLYKTLRDQDLHRIYSQSAGARGAAQSLVSSAFESGSDDNISVAIAEYGEVVRVPAGGTMPLDFVASSGAARRASAAVSAGATTADAATGSSGEVGGAAQAAPQTTAAKTSRPASAPDVAPRTASAAAPRSGPPVRVIAIAVAIVGAIVAFLVFGG
jgi:hypothetical protein